MRTSQSRLMLAVVAIISTASLAVQSIGFAQVVANLVSAGGGTTKGSQFSLSSSLGQPFSGKTVGIAVSEHVGFWYLPVSKSVSTDVAEDLIEDLDGELLPLTFSLADVYPNPARSSATILLELPRVSHVRAMLYDLTGRRVRLILDATRPAGRHAIGIKTERLPSGTYYLRLIAGEFSETRIVQVVR